MPKKPPHHCARARITSGLLPCLQWKALTEYIGRRKVHTSTRSLRQRQQCTYRPMFPPPPQPCASLSGHVKVLTGLCFFFRSSTCESPTRLSTRLASSRRDSKAASEVVEAVNQEATMEVEVAATEVEGAEEEEEEGVAGGGGNNG